MYFGELMNFKYLLMNFSDMIEIMFNFDLKLKKKNAKNTVI